MLRLRGISVAEDLANACRLLESEGLVFEKDFSLDDARELAGAAILEKEHEADFAGWLKPFGARKAHAFAGYDGSYRSLCGDYSIWSYQEEEFRARERVACCRCAAIARERRLRRR